MTAPDPSRQKEQDKLADAVRRDQQRDDTARRKRHGAWRYTVMLGTVAVMLVLPAVAGAYLGQWLDSGQSTFSSRWTVSLIVVGVVVGAYNAYAFIKEHWE